MSGKLKYNENLQNFIKKCYLEKKWVSKFEFKLVKLNIIMKTRYIFLLMTVFFILFTDWEKIDE